MASSDEAGPSRKRKHAATDRREREGGENWGLIRGQ